jgi:hypothetical protein
MLKRLLNLPESVTDQRLREVCNDFDAKVYAKVRIADVLPIENSGIDNEHYRYALLAHFDFVITDSDDKPLFTVEFDGSSHSSPEVQRRDQIKNSLCDRFALPLLRINCKYLTKAFSNWDLLRWFCTVFFVKKSWDKAVEEGRIPPDDSIFDPMFVSVRTKSGMRSLELEKHARAEFGNLFRSGKIPFYVPNWITAKGSGRTLRAISWIKTSEQQGALVETAMQYQNLDSWIQFAIRGIVLSQLQERVSAVIIGKESPLPISTIEDRVKRFENMHKSIMSLRSSTNHA